MPFLLISATFNDSRLYELRGECPSPAGAEDKDKIIQDSKFKNLSDYRRIHPSTGVTVSLSNCSGFRLVHLTVAYGLKNLSGGLSPEGA